MHFYFTINLDAKFSQMCPSGTKMEFSSLCIIWRIR